TRSRQPVEHKQPQRQQNITNTEQLVFIAALNISYELTQQKAKTRDYASSMEQRIRMLQQTIEQALLEQGRISERTGPKFE
ncbi:cell division protein ZapA, partial [Raoultella planticola]|uniref:cell division protein ZapA n=1 Tax=Raoultella planticola TaxID=575 RepID=UPI003D00F7EA